ncbi:hypothetical protein K491DRAFT_691312 [Lophiostoma macrostomum CBS 122681]|uniref:Rhodopsin domain-containing protein n=1 Tax=Lophiostoma macrostomum CBS 122681 TaxID=1314788 RepID=A0A6A6TEP9_9PLEO|nr:hypothetical protein K491DRAFT_691312 [Lophiostoma macrostomum CBS 122681]
MPGSQTVELWTLYALGVSFTILRTYARIVAVGVRDLRADDYLIWLAVLIYTTQCSLGYTLGTAAHGLANNGLTAAERSALAHDDPEYNMRVTGSKIQVAGWTAASCLLWTLKICVAIFYLRLMNGLDRYRIRIFIAMGLIATTFVALILTIFLSCRPFNHYWQINPDPGNICQAAISKPIVWTMFVTNVSTDVYLFVLPVSMLWKSSLRLLKKLAATMVLSGGLLIIVCATLKSIYVIVDPVHGGELAASWGTRETFIAVVTTNLPMVFPLLRVWITPFLPSNLRSSSNNKAAYKPGSGFVTIGGGGPGASNRSGPGSQSARDVMTNMTFDNDSEENIGPNGDMKMQILHTADGRQRALSPNEIVVSRQVNITVEDASSEKSTESFQRI